MEMYKNFEDFGNEHRAEQIRFANILNRAMGLL
jgi:hypothetical protein